MRNKLRKIYFNFLFMGILFHIFLSCCQDVTDWRDSSYLLYFVEQLYDLQLQRDIDWEHSS